MLIEEKVKNIIKNELGVRLDEITLESNFVKDLYCDSIDAIELTMAIEEEFDIEIPDKDVKLLDTVGKLVNYIRKRKGGKSNDFNQ